MRTLPKESKYNLLKGTWFVYNSTDFSIAIYLSNTGKIEVYHNEEQVVDERSFKLKLNFSYAKDNQNFEISIKPHNKMLTKFECLLKKDNNILRTFMYAYNYDWRKKVVLYLLIFAATIPLVIYDAPTWLYIISMLLTITIALILQAKSLVKITEYDNPIDFEFLD